MVERGVRFVQVYHNNWDHHANVAGRMPSQCKDVDQACWGLIQDLKSRGLLDETLVIWGGDSAGRSTLKADCRTRIMVATITRAASPCGWLEEVRRAGRSTVKPTSSLQHYQRPGAHPRFPCDCLAIAWLDHRRFTFRYQGLDQRLTGVEPARVVKELLA